MDGSHLQQFPSGITANDGAGYGGLGQVLGKGQQQRGGDPLIGMVGGCVQDAPLP